MIDIGGVICLMTWAFVIGLFAGSFLRQLNKEKP